MLKDPVTGLFYANCPNLVYQIIPMKSILTICLLSLCFLFTTSQSCKRDMNGNNNNCEGVACTMLFASITVNITDSSGKAVKLDDAYTINGKTSETIRYEQDPNSMGYTVLDDSYQKHLVNTSSTFQFIGMKDGKQVVNAPFVISADCCHISKVSGETEIIIP